MPNLISILSELAEVGLDKGTLDEAVAESPEVRTGVIMKAKECENFWKSIAPVDRSDRGEHLIYDETNSPEDYKHPHHL
jgi:hypothetical protein